LVRAEQFLAVSCRPVAALPVAVIYMIVIM
jgi:hypothetical protein